ncbi:MAG: M23 family metallopeptidase [Acidobacteria bacterium]|nr:M23 family metallopeptidase [Acidobacteriota bacterium]
MQKNKNSYRFLLSHSTKSTIYIRRFEVSKKLLHSSIAVFILSFGIISLGVAGLVKNNVLAKTDNLAATETAAIVSSTTQTISEPKTIDYSRPAQTENFAANSGGPVLDVQSTEEEAAESENGDIADQIRAIQSKANPEFLPTMWAHLGKINNEFGFRRNPFGGRSYEFHPGMDIDGEKGDTVIAPANGTVIKAGWTGGYGNMIEIDHGNGISTRYGHLSKIEVQVGDSIQRGQLIGLIGSTGRSTGPHLHYELRLNEKSINPRFLLPQEPADLKQ